MRYTEDVVAEVQLLKGCHVICVFSIAFVGEPFPPRPGNHVVAFFRAVIAASLTVHVVILQIPPPFFEFFAPEASSPHARIAPGEIVVMEAVILIHSHPISDLRIIRKFLVQSLAYLEQLRRPGNMDVFCSTNSDRLKSFVSHNRPRSSSGTAATAVDGCRIDSVFTGYADGRHMSSLLLQLLPDVLCSFMTAFSAEMGGIPNFYFVIIDPEIDQVRSFAGYDYFVITGVL